MQIQTVAGISSIIRSSSPSAFLIRVVVCFEPIPGKLGVKSEYTHAYGCYIKYKMSMFNLALNRYRGKKRTKINQCTCCNHALAVIIH